MTERNVSSERVYRHKKRGTEYVLIGIGKMQADGWVSSPKGIAPVDMREVAVYRSVTDPTEIWARPREEFEDGRFEALPTAAPAVSSERVSEERLGRFNHHPAPAIDFEIEVQSLEARLYDAKGGISKPGTMPESVSSVLAAIDRAMDFRVGGDPSAVSAKGVLRKLQDEAVLALRSSVKTEDAILPCDVSLPPATTIRAGAKLSTLIEALNVRGMAAIKAPAAASEVTEDRVIAGAQRVFELFCGKPIDWSAEDIDSHESVLHSADWAQAIAYSRAALKGDRP